MIEYRRQRSSDTWHWCRNCTQWPTTDYERRDTHPTTGDKCRECRRMEVRRTCRCR